MAVRGLPPALADDVGVRLEQADDLLPSRHLLLQQDAPRSLAPRGAARFLRLRGESRWEIDLDKIAAAARWDGLHGVVTNVRGMPAAELLARYRDLWQVERGFRVNKHDLKVRPIHHWTPRPSGDGPGGTTTGNR